MGGFLGIGGSSAKTDRKNTLVGFGELQNLFNFGLDTAKGAISTGQGAVKSGTDALSSSLNYFKTLMSGNRAATAAAVAPETNAVLASSDAARANQVTEGTSRSGGTAAGTQTANDKVMAAIDNYLFAVRPTAASAVSDIGSKLAGIGLGEENLGLGFAGLAESSAAELTDASIKSRELSFNINQQIVSEVTGAISSLLTSFATPGSFGAKAGTAIGGF